MATLPGFVVLLQEPSCWNRTTSTTESGLFGATCCFGRVGFSFNKNMLTTTWEPAGFCGCSKYFPRFKRKFLFVLDRIIIHPLYIFLRKKPLKVIMFFFSAAHIFFKKCTHPENEHFSPLNINAVGRCKTHLRIPIIWHSQASLHLLPTYHPPPTTHHLPPIGLGTSQCVSDASAEEECHGESWGVGKLSCFWWSERLPWRFGKWEHISIWGTMILPRFWEYLLQKYIKVPQIPNLGTENFGKCTYIFYTCFIEGWPYSTNSTYKRDLWHGINMTALSV